MSNMDQHERRISTLESDVSALKLDVSKINFKLDAHAERAEQRHKDLSRPQLRIVDFLEGREREAKEYRERREQREKDEAAAHAQWVRSLINPQTIVIILGVLLSLMGTRIADVREVAEMVGTPIHITTKPQVVPLATTPALAPDTPEE